MRDVCLECFSKVGFDLRIDSLEDRRSGIEVHSTRVREGRTYATIFIPRGKLPVFISKIEAYETKTFRGRPDGSPVNQKLVESIEGVRLPVVRSLFTDSDSVFPGRQEIIWWEVWLRNENSKGDDRFVEFLAALGSSKIEVSEQVVYFPERLVFLLRATASQLAVDLSLLFQVAELRRAKEVPTDFLELPLTIQSEFVKDAADRLSAPMEGAPAVCVLDSGVTRSHPLLACLLKPEDNHAIHPDWPKVDDIGHGTQVCGLAVFQGALEDHLEGTDRFDARFWLESVKILKKGEAHERANYGYVTTEAVALAEGTRPERRRVICMTVSADDRDEGFPSLWSAAIDQHSAGAIDDVRRLYVLSSGNVSDVLAAAADYPGRNHRQGVEDPGQSWNALTVGAYTERVFIRSPKFAGYEPLAPPGALCPTSSTSLPWPDPTWPLKPDIVMEGGNYVRSPSGETDFCEDLGLLTTAVHSSGRLLGTAGDTSAAAALASGLAGDLMAEYPAFWPETIRGLMVHSARWTDRMCKEFPEESRERLQNRIRCYGYGVPDRERAFRTASNEVSLICQGELRPFRLDGSDAKSNEYTLHELPWPKQLLEDLGDLPVSVRVTLSYFVEPSPGRRGWKGKFRYASHGLRFALRGPTETDSAFEVRISREQWPEDGDRPSTAEPEEQDWLLGTRLRTRGSIHSDVWSTGTCAQVARCGGVAVFPVIGWWRERKHLGRVERLARYSLVVTLETPAQEVDLLTPIQQEITQRVAIQA